ncbi:MAG: sensor histidine kinase [Candidatus Thorarchaeota archaeon]|nr:sensor histidine kinase [Candidatus Thorarchaeota archaeon]
MVVLRHSTISSKADCHVIHGRLERNDLRDALLELDKGRLIERILELPKTLTRPAQIITEGGQRRRARFLRTALFTALCVFPILQVTSDPVQGIPFYSSLTIFAASVYLLSGTIHIRLAAALTIVCAACIPIVTITLYPVWTRDALAFQILTWPVLSVLLATQLISIRKQSLLTGGLSIALIVLALIHPGILLSNALETVAVFFAIGVLLMFTSWNQNYYSIGLEQSNRSLEARRRELEIYTSLLRHDLGNDLQLILGGIELSQMANGEPRQAAFLESTYAAAQRMRSLLHIFSMTDAELDDNIVEILEKIGKRAEIAFKGMRVSITIADEVRDKPPKYGRLVALAFENLLRNASQHAGINPNVEIEITRVSDTLEIVLEDDGPGIDQNIRESLFEKGTSTGSEGKGLGLYLAKTIIESENGSISLVSTNGSGCCFLIRLPYEHGA